MRRLIERLGVFCAAIFPPAGLLLLGALRVRGPFTWSFARGWFVLWLGFLAPLVASRLLLFDFAGTMLLTLELLPYLLAAILLRAKPSAVRAGLLAALVLLVSAAVAERWSSALAWNNFHSSVLVSALGAPIQGGESLDVFGERQWALAPDTAALQLAFEARWLSGERDWDWHRSEPNFSLEPRYEDGEVFTRAVTPRGADPYLFRSFNTGEPIAGRTFRVALELRAPEAIAAEGCRGVWLQAWGRGGAAGCLAVALGREWRAFELAWTAPLEVESPSIHIVLNDFDGLSFDVRRVRLYERVGDEWQALTPISPSGAHAQLLWQGQTPGLEATLNFMPQETWQRYVLTVRDSSLLEGGVVKASFQISSGLKIKTRGVSLTAPDSADPFPLPMRGRQSLWFGHPNLAGHTVAATGLALISGVRSVRLGFAGLALSLLGIGLTGSRGAWLAMLLGLAGFLLLNYRRKEPLWLLFGLGLMSVIALFGLGSRGRLQSLDGELTSRPEIWAVAWQALRDNPLSGVGAGRFGSYFAANYPGTSSEAVQHAHNLWLAFASDYGLAGVVAILWFTFGLSMLAWRWGRWRGLLLVVPVFAMNLFDTTLLFSGVLFPLLLAMNSLRLQKGAVGSPKIEA
ncbi:MAG: O-antigen ligase family protein [Deinococcota bacterium]|nr:O-antigen ligase family protein [Deinococcota bacterium]